MSRQWARIATVIIAIAAAVFALSYGFHGGALSLLISITVFYLISVATPRRPIAADVEAVMDM